TARALTAAVCPVNCRSGCRRPARSQLRTTLSAPPVKTRLPSGLTTAMWTALGWGSARVGAGGLAHSLRGPSRAPVRRWGDAGWGGGGGGGGAGRGAAVGEGPAGRGAGARLQEEGPPGGRAGREGGAVGRDGHRLHRSRGAREGADGLAVGEGGDAHGFVRAA